MIVCSCREISTNQYQDPEDLKERIMQDDALCGTCQHDIAPLTSQVSTNTNEEIQK